MWDFFLVLGAKGQNEENRIKENDTPPKKKKKKRKEYNKGKEIQREVVRNKKRWVQTLIKCDGQININYKKFKMFLYFKYKYKLLKLKLPWMIFKM